MSYPQNPAESGREYPGDPGGAGMSPGPGGPDYFGSPGGPAVQPQQQSTPSDRGGPVGKTSGVGGKSLDADGHRHSRTGGAWVSAVVALVVLIFLLIFILQNSNPASVKFLGFAGSLQLGIAMLFAAIAGALVVALLGTIRILQLRSRARKASR